MSSTFLKRTLRWFFNSTLSRERRRRLGSFLLNEACGDNNDDAVTNGEYAVLEQFIRSSKAPRIIFDVGANVGDWSRKFLSLAGAADSLIAFEPSPKTFQALESSLASDKRAQCINAALGEREGEAQLNVASDLSGTNSLHRRDFTGQSQTADVRIETGDAFSARKGIERIDFLKLDTEGHELAVLAGFQSMLQRRAIPLIQFEYGGTWLDARITLADAFTLLQLHGYSIAKIYPRGLQFIDQYAQSLDTFQYANFLAMLPDWKAKFSRID